MDSSFGLMGHSIFFRKMLLPPYFEKYLDTYYSRIYQLKKIFPLMNLRLKLFLHLFLLFVNFYFIHIDSRCLNLLFLYLGSNFKEFYYYFFCCLHHNMMIFHFNFMISFLIYYFIPISI